MEARRDLIRLGVITAAALAAAATVWAIVAKRRGMTMSPDGVVDTQQEQQRSGSIADRGKGGVAIDVERLRRAEEDLEPAVEYLTYIQSKRGVNEHLLFVRDEDLDAIAALEGDDPSSFLERLQHLGVVISTN